MGTIKMWFLLIKLVLLVYLTSFTSVVAPFHYNDDYKWRGTHSRVNSAVSTEKPKVRHSNLDRVLNKVENLKEGYTKNPYRFHPKTTTSTTTTTESDIFGDYEDPMYDEDDEYDSLFRHGDRTTDAGSTYPTDPYANATYWPYGPGQLTNAGKVREYNLGLQLRQRYDSFLGDLYFQGLVDARSTDYNRTKASLELVLAGLYPPNARLRWNWFLNWQAIPFNYAPLTNDPLLYGFGCPNVNTYLAEYFATEDYITRGAPYADLLEYISEYAGTSYTFLTGGFFYFGLETQDEWGFKLPEWTDPIYPDATYQLCTEYYKTITATTDLKKLMSGGLIQKIVSDSQSKLAGTLEDTNIFLYSAHEMTVGSLLNTLGVFDPQVPQYGSYVTLEVHTIDNDNYIKTDDATSPDDDEEEEEFLDDEDYEDDDPYLENNNFNSREVTSYKEPERITPQPSSFTEFKWRHYGTRSGVEESRRNQMNLGNGNNNLVNRVIEHAVWVNTEAKCRKPSAKVIPVQTIHPDPTKNYVPHCTILHRCAEDTGCCSNHATRCAPKKQSQVHLYFYTKTLGVPGNKVVRLSFYNHTECACLEKSKINNPVGDTNTSEEISSKSGISVRSAGLFHSPFTPENLRRCKCSSEYIARLQQDFTCSCDCSESNMGCQQMKKGREYFSLTDRRCILNKQCGVPKCEYGVYIKQTGRCPKKQEMLSEYRKLTFR